MSIFSRMFNKNAKPRPQVLPDYTSTPRLFTTENNSTTFACIDRIASEFASLNFAVYDKKTRQKVKKHRLIEVLREPNSEDRHFNFFYQSAVDYFNGGCYWLKVIVDGEVWGLHRLNAHQVITMRNPQTNEKYYNYNGTIYSVDDILFIPSRFGYNTLRGGTSIFNAADSAFQTMRYLDQFTQASFSNGVIGKRVVIATNTSKLTDEQLEATRERFQKNNAGVENAGKPIIQDAGTEFKELGSGTDNRGAELSENRKFQEHEIAKIFGVPERLISTGGENAGTLEDAFLLFNEFAIRPLAAQFQDAINSLLDENHYYFEFDFNGVLKVSFEKRIDAYIKQINNGLLSPNEARAKENLSAIEAGDTYWGAVNLMPRNEETVKAYMAKQKNELAKSNTDNESDSVNPTDENAQHFGGGDDKQ